MAKPVKVLIIEDKFDGGFMSQVNKRILRANGFDESTPHYLNDSTYQNRVQLVYRAYAITSAARVGFGGWGIHDATDNLKKVEAIVAEEFGYTS